MRKLILAAAVILPLIFVSQAASALPLHPIGADTAVSADLVEIKGGHGRGGGHGGGWGRGHGGYHPFGWSRGRKVGWRGRGCPPGHWKKGWC